MGCRRPGRRRAEAAEHLLQDGPVVVGRRVGGEPVVQHPGAVAERVLSAVVRAGDVPVERHGHVADHDGHGWFPFVGAALEAWIRWGAVVVSPAPVGSCVLTDTASSATLIMSRTAMRAWEPTSAMTRLAMSGNP